MTDRELLDDLRALGRELNDPVPRYGIGQLACLYVQRHPQGSPAEDEHLCNRLVSMAMSELRAAFIAGRALLDANEQGKPS